MTAGLSCWKCGKRTPVHAIQVVDLEECEPDEEPDCLAAATIVYELSPSGLPAAVRVGLPSKAQNYKLLYSRTVGEVSWANASVQCGLLQGAFFLHYNPDGPFFGVRTLLSAAGFDVDDGGDLLPLDRHAPARQ